MNLRARVRLLHQGSRSIDLLLVGKPDHSASIALYGNSSPCKQLLNASNRALSRKLAFTIEQSSHIMFWKDNYAEECRATF